MAVRLLKRVLLVLLLAFITLPAALAGAGSGGWNASGPATTLLAVAIDLSGASRVCTGGPGDLQRSADGSR